MSIFKPKSANKKNYQQYEKDLYIALETLKSMCQEEDDGKDKQFYIIDRYSIAYKRAFKLSYSLIRFYTKEREGNKEFMFKSNFLLSKTNGLFSNQKTTNQGLSELYTVRKEQVNGLPGEYFKMFKIAKYFENSEQVESQ